MDDEHVEVPQSVINLFQTMEPGLTLRQLNLIEALKQGKLSWFEFFEKWREDEGG